MKHARIAATLFALWGLLHVAGGLLILFSLGDGAAAAYAVYGVTGVAFPDIAGAALGYLAYSFVWIGALVIAVALRYNWNNSAAGLMLNTALTGLTELGLLVFLLLPGHVSWLEASAGLLLFAGAIVSGGKACHGSPAPRASTT